MIKKILPKIKFCNKINFNNFEALNCILLLKSKSIVFVNCQQSVANESLCSNMYLKVSNQLYKNQIATALVVVTTP